MNFTKQNIPAKTLCVVDIGSYKLRVCAARFKNTRIEILGYSEKRQDISYFANQECLNLPGLCNNIIDAIEKLEKSIEEKLPEIVINYPFGEIFLRSKKINHKRNFPHTPLTQEELNTIMESVEKLCLKKLSEEIDKLYGLSQNEVQILLSRVNQVLVDGEPTTKILNHEGEQINISLLNAFIPTAKHQLLTQIGNVLEKSVYRILPIEYCITKAFPESDIVIINIGATQTTLSVKIENEIVGVSKIPIGINDLITKITKNHQITRERAIEKLPEDIHTQEKEEFLSIWGESVGIGLKEILEDQICPKNFYIGGGGGNNNFIKDFLSNLPLGKYDVKSFHGNISFLAADITRIIEPISHIRVEDVEKIPLDMYVLLLETNSLISQTYDAISISLKHAIKTLGYIKS